MTIRRQQPPAPVEDWYRIDVRNAADEQAAPSAADVHLYEAIGGWWGVNAREFVQDLAALDVEQINLYVNSPGGSVFDGVAIMNALRRHKARVVATVEGLAASAASFVVQAADEIVMARGAEMMIHDAWTIVLGNAGDLREYADQLDRLSNSIAGLYAERAGGTREQWRDAMRAETWYDADEAVAAGLADRTAASGADAKDALDSARHDRTIFAHAGRAQAPAPFIPTAHARATHRPPAELLVDTINPQPEGTDTMSDALKAGICAQLGISDADAANLDDDALLGRLTEALAAPQPTTAPGTVMLDEATLNQLRTDAQAGRDAREKQIVAERTALVNAAVQDGRIAPARREHWLASLEADPGSAEVLAKLEPGTVPLTARGYTGGVNEVTDEDAIYAKAWGQASTTKEA